MFFGVSSSVTECFQSVTDYLQPVTELGTPKNMAVALPGMTLQSLYMYERPGNETSGPTQRCMWPLRSLAS